MQSLATNIEDNDAAPLAPARKVITEPDFTGTPQSIGQWTELPDFPQCALGAYVNINGYAGVVVEIVKQSIKVLSPDGTTQRFNAGRLKTLFAPPERSSPSPEELPADHSKPAGQPGREQGEVEGAPPMRVHITDPDFTAPVRAIRTYASQADFPQCAYGKHVDIPGYSGVVVEIVMGSIKVQSPAGTIRSYNGQALKKLYGGA